ncbi:MAG TPA: NAD(P)H-hydrate epimerase [Pirellulales bacterium]|nr:NAD(P)H-hydrate epimerase [Pirellulales bacterium]
MTTPRLPTLTCRQVREIDRRAVDEYGLSGLVLMENAGRGLADTLCALGIAGHVVVCCGKGNNAGDGFVLARHLDLRRVEVRTVTWAETSELRGDAAVNFRVLERCGVPIEVFGRSHDVQRFQKHLVGAGWIVDALLGTGAAGEPRPPLDAVIDQINDSGIPVLAVDLPSGLDADTGAAARHTIRAAHTCTFVAAKPGLLSPHAKQYTGEVHVRDIGAPRKLVDEVLAQAATRTSTC